jgi:hypothetical protein
VVFFILVAGTGLEPVSAAADISPTNFLEFKIKKTPSFSSGVFYLSSGNRTRTYVRRGGYKPDELLEFKIKKTPSFSSGVFYLVAGTGLEPVTFGL